MDTPIEKNNVPNPAVGLVDLNGYQGTKFVNNPGLASDALANAQLKLAQQEFVTHDREAILGVLGFDALNGSNYRTVNSRNNTQYRDLLDIFISQQAILIASPTIIELAHEVNGELKQKPVFYFVPTGVLLFRKSNSAVELCDLFEFANGRVSPSINKNDSLPIVSYNPHKVDHFNASYAPTTLLDSDLGKGSDVFQFQRGSLCLRLYVKPDSHILVSTCSGMVDPEVLSRESTQLKCLEHGQDLTRDLGRLINNGVDRTETRLLNNQIGNSSIVLYSANAYPKLYFGVRTEPSLGLTIVNQGLDNRHIKLLADIESATGLKSSIPTEVRFPSVATKAIQQIHGTVATIDTKTPLEFAKLWQALDNVLAKGALGNSTM